MKTNDPKVEKADLRSAGGSPRVTRDARSGYSTRQADADAARGKTAGRRDMTSLARTGGRTGQNAQGSESMVLRGTNETTSTSRSYASGSAPVSEQMGDQSPSNSFGSGRAPVAEQVGNEKPSNSFASPNPRS